MRRKPKPRRWKIVTQYHGLICVDKTKNLLTDNTKFLKPIHEKNKTEIIVKQLIEGLKRMKDDQSINEDIYELIKRTGSIILRPYSLPKIRESGLPLQPILDMSRSPYYSIAQRLAYVVKPLRKRNYIHSLHDTFEFIE